ncbi:hypothetical protein MMC22_004597 [Lobaria immixta]|nr:hypothetical protein [Lobaria immixta]
MFKKIFGGKKTRGVRKYKHDPTCLDEREHPAVPIGEQSNAPTIASETRMPDQIPLDDGVTNQDPVFLVEEVALGENRPDPLAQIEHGVSLPWVVSENNLGHTRAMSDGTVQNPEGQSSFPGSIVRLDSVENRATSSKDSKTGSECLESPKGTSQSSHTLQHSEQLPPVGRSSPESTRTTEVQHEDHKSDGASIKSADEGTWELWRQSVEQGYKDDLADRQDIYEDELKALKLDHQEEIMVVEAEKEALQRRVQELESGKATMGAELEAKEGTIRQLVGASQCLQQKHDQLLEQCKRASAESASRKEVMGVELEAKEATIGQLVEASQCLQQQHDLLKEQCKRASAQSEPTDRANLNHQNLATLIAIEERKVVEKELERALIAKKGLEKDLEEAHGPAALWEDEVHRLNVALAQTPEEVANIRGVIELKDQMFLDLEIRAGECFTALTELEGIRAEEKETAAREIASLKADLGKHISKVENLRRSKKAFQGQCEDVFAMLQRKVSKNDLTNAMEEYFQTTIHDNSFLQTEVERQAGEISGCNARIALLETAVRNAARSLEAKSKAGDEMELALRAKDVDLGALQVDLDWTTADHQSAIEEKKGELADTERKLRKAQAKTAELIRMGRDEREQWILKSKDDKIAALEKNFQHIQSSHRHLNHLLDDRDEIIAKNQEVADSRRAELRDTQIQLEAAWAVLENQQEQFRDLLRLPASINMADVLAMRNALGEARLRILELEGAGREGAVDDGLYGVSDVGEDGGETWDDVEGHGEQGQGRDNGVSSNNSDCSFF